MDSRTIIQSPFTPFVVLFCHTIEMSDRSDLQLMQNLLTSLESAPQTGEYGLCRRQLRLFRALYDVAEKYIEVKSRAYSGGDNIPLFWGISERQGCISEGTHAPSNSITSGSGAASVLPGNISSADVFSGPSSTSVNDTSLGSAFTGQMSENLDMEMDLSGAQLWDWFNKNQSIMRMLEEA